MLKGVSLINMLFFLVDYIWVASVHYVFDEVCRVIDFCKAFLILDAVSSFF